MTTDTKAAHTPGPWFVDIERGYPMPIEDKDGIWICQIGDGCGRCTDDPIEAEANARLIAAAPDLLASLKSMRAWLGGQCFEGDTIGSMRRMLADADRYIAKAEGR